MKTTFVIGDVHGCRKTFDELLRRIEFDRRRHALWLVGDIVNRGPDSLGMLRRAHKLHGQMGRDFKMVLGNHDLHLLGVAAGARRTRPRDTLKDVLGARDAGDLLAWLRSRKLAHYDHGYLLVHAGILPHWSVGDVLFTAAKLRRRLRKGRRIHSRKASRSLTALTKVRMLDARGRISAYSGEPEDAPKKLTSWYKLWARNAVKGDDPVTVLFGHWAALGCRRGGRRNRQWISLDSGCVYGHALTALRLPDGEFIHQPTLEGDGA